MIPSRDSTFHKMDSRPQMGWQCLWVFALVLCLVVTWSLPAFSATAKLRGYCSHGQKTSILFVDRTTVYDDTDRTDFKSGVNRFYGSLNPGDRFEIYSITDDASSSKKLFAGCLAECASSNFFGDRFSRCDSVRQAQDKFEQILRLRKVFNHLLRKPNAYRQSDIARTLARVTRQQGNAREAAGFPPVNQVFIYSDLIEHSQIFQKPTFLSQPPDHIVERFREERAIPQLAGATISVFGCGRDHGRGRPPLSQSKLDHIKEVWRKTFELGNATSVRFKCS